MVQRPEMPRVPWMPEIPAVPAMPDLSESPARSGDSPTESVPLEPETATSQRAYSTPDSIEVLARLERGEITVEEAMADLDALR